MQKNGVCGPPPLAFLKSAIVVVVRMIEEAFVFFEQAPRLIFEPLTLPIAAFAKHFKVGLVRRLEGPGGVDFVLVAVWIRGSGRVRFASPERIVDWGDAVFEQTVQFEDLSIRNADGVFHDAPMIGVAPTFRSIVAGRIEFGVTGWDGLCAGHAEVILGLAPNHGEIVEPIDVFVIQQLAVRLRLGQLLLGQFFLGVHVFDKGIPIEIFHWIDVAFVQEDSVLWFVIRFEGVALQHVQGGLCLGAAPRGIEGCGVGVLVAAGTAGATTTAAQQVSTAGRFTFVVIGGRSSIAIPATVQITSGIIVVDTGQTAFRSCGFFGFAPLTNEFVEDVVIGSVVIRFKENGHRRHLRVL